MKKHITVEQFQELTGEQKERLRKQVGISHPWVRPVLSIGQMIELLGDDYWKVLIQGGVQVSDEGKPEKFMFNCIKAENVTDTLWQAVKEVL